ncbi:MAG: phage head morphogenesis protein [Treponema sp.]|nr:phage head morphogenesis protein [Treponema sp.]
MYETNMRTAYMQAQYRKQLQGAELRPIWMYQSQLAGKNRRREHIALHGKAYRYDDPFWDTCYPPNGWGCQCYVTTKSEAGAERDGIKESWRFHYGSLAGN